MSKPPFDPRLGGIIAAKITPAVVLALFGYSAWIITVPLATNYLLNPPESYHLPKRRTAAIVILVIYYLILSIVATVYLRLLLTVTLRPGIVRKGDDVAQAEKGQAVTSTGFPSLENPAPGLENFYKYDVFVSEGTGRPIWCQKCQHYKPDRTRHCSELDKCVRKMDHFCPWVGGVVAEQSFKFFIQFTGYSFFMAVFLIVVLAYYTAERAKVDPRANVHWIVMLAVSAFLGLFATVMTCTSSYLAFHNSTSIEQLSGKRSMSLAVLIPQHMEKELESNTSRSFKTVTYPLAPAPDPNDMSATPPPPNPDARTFAVLHTKAGQNVWDLGLLENWKTVMGDHVWEWFSPFSRSPAVLYEGTESAYKLGPVIDTMRKEAGLPIPDERVQKRRHRRKSRSKHSDEKSSGA